MTAVNPIGALSVAQARAAVDRCDDLELAILRAATAHEAALMLEAKFFGGAHILDGLPDRCRVEDEQRVLARAAMDRLFG